MMSIVHRNKLTDNATIWDISFYTKTWTDDRAIERTKEKVHKIDCRLVVLSFFLIFIYSFIFAIWKDMFQNVNVVVSYYPSLYKNVRKCYNPHLDPKLFVLKREINYSKNPRIRTWVLRTC